MPFLQGNGTWHTGLSCAGALVVTASIGMAVWPDEAVADTPAFKAASVLLGAMLALLAGIDTVSLRLPNILTLPLLAAGLILAPLVRHTGYEWHAVGAVAGYLLLAGAAAAYVRLRGQHGIGLGDAKLYAAAGAWNGLDGLPSVLLLASAFGLVAVAIVALLRHGVGRMTRIPFGPFLAAAVWIVWLVGPLA